MYIDFRELRSKAGIGGIGLLSAGSIWRAIEEGILWGTIGKLFTAEGVWLVPYLLMIAGFIIILVTVLSGPKLKIICQPTREPYKHEWPVQNGPRRILFRVEIRNESQYKAINRAVVKITDLKPFADPCVCIPMCLAARGGSVTLGEILEECS